MKITKIEETNLGPLWARATYGKKYPELLSDPIASEIISQLGFDFTEIGNFLGEWRSIGLLRRARRFDNALKNYMEDHPSTTVVNVGAGLDVIQ